MCEGILFATIMPSNTQLDKSCRRTAAAVKSGSPTAQNVLVPFGAGLQLLLGFWRSLLKADAEGASGGPP